MKKRSVRLRSENGYAGADSSFGDSASVRAKNTGRKRVAAPLSRAFCGSSGRCSRKLTFNRIPSSVELNTGGVGYRALFALLRSSYPSFETMKHPLHRTISRDDYRDLGRVFWRIEGRRRRFQPVDSPRSCLPRWTGLPPETDRHRSMDLERSGLFSRLADPVERPDRRAPARRSKRVAASVGNVCSMSRRAETHQKRPNLCRRCAVALSWFYMDWFAVLRPCKAYATTSRRTVISR